MPLQQQYKKRSMFHNNFPMISVLYHHHSSQLLNQNLLKNKQKQRHQQQRYSASFSSVYKLLIVLVLTNWNSMRGFVLAFSIPATRSLSSSSLSSAFTRATTTKLLSTMSNTDTYDVIIIGGGSAGLTAAKLIGPTLQKTCCIIEQSRMGGDCTWTGCIPSKSFIHASKLYYNQHQTTSVDTNGKTTCIVPPLADLSIVKNDIQNKILQIYDSDDSPEALQKIGKGTINVISGTAKIISSKEVTISNTASAESTTTTTTTEQQQQRTIYAKEGIILCTGAEPKVPTMIPGLYNNPSKYYTYENLWTKLVSIPKQLTIIGGGPISCEIAQAMSRFGSKVTIITSSLLSQFDTKTDTDILQCIHNIFTNKYNITIIIGTITKVDHQDDTTGSTHTAYVVEKDTKNTLEINGDAILVAIGRQPRIDKELLGPTIQLTTNDRAIRVNDQLQTSVKNIYAAGDCTGDQQFTHYAGYQGAIAARNLLLPFTDPGVLDSVPSAIFTYPEIASIGISETVAIKRYGVSNIIVYTRKLSDVDRAICDDEIDGIIKIICLKSNEQVLGATIISPVAGEMISEIAILMKYKISFDKLATVMHPYPSYSMALQFLAAEVYYKKTMKMKWLLDILKTLGF